VPRPLNKDLAVTKSTVDFNDPVARAKHIERVGSEQYSRDLAAWVERSAVAKVNGWVIRPVQTRYGRLYAVGDMAFRTYEEAVDCALACSPREG
jgi:hypothetical protein